MIQANPIRNQIHPFKHWQQIYMTQHSQENSMANSFSQLPIELPV